MQDDLISILKKRLAMGEISLDEYNELFLALAGDNEQLSESSTLTTPQLQDGPVILLDENNWFGDVKFSHKGNIYSVDKIISINSSQYTQTISFVTSYYVGLALTLLDRSVVEYKANSTFINTKKIKNMKAAIEFIHKKTFAQRANQYLHQIKTKGFFEYHNYFIYSNGDIRYKNKTVNIADSALQNGVEFGRKSSFGFNSFFTPDEIWVNQKIQGKFLLQNICIKIKENRDVVYAILIKLAELKNGKVTFTNC